MVNDLLPGALGLLACGTASGLLLLRERRDHTTAMLCAAASIVISLAAWHHFAVGERWLICTLIAAFAPTATWTDLTCHRVRNYLTASLAGSAAVLVAGLCVVSGRWVHGLSAVVCALLVGVVYLACSFLGGLGMGDVKLAAALALVLGWCGPASVFVAVVVATLAGVCSAVAVVVRHRDVRRHFAFAPSIVVGFLAASFLR